MRASDSIAYPPALEADEAGLLEIRRRAGQTEQAPATADATMLPRDAIGFALSGGGVRSATFSLGVFQALAASKSIGRIDYLSTVSGGTYVAAFMCRLFMRSWISGVDDVEQVLQGRDPHGTPSDRAGWGARAFRWLRDNARYLSPRGSGDLLVLGAVLLRNWAAVQVVLATTVLTTFLGLHVIREVAQHGALRLTPWADVRPFLQCVLPLGDRSIWWSPWVTAPLAPLALWVVPTGWAYWLIARERSRSLPPAAGAALALAAALFGAFYYAPGRSPGPGHTHRFTLCAAVALVAAVTFLVRWLALQIGRNPGEGAPTPSETDSRARTRLSRWLASGLVCSGMLAAIGLVDTAGRTIYALAEGGQLVRIEALALGMFAAIAAFARPLWTLLGSLRVSRHPRLLMSVVSWVAAVLLLSAWLVALNAVSHGIVWQFGAALGAPPALAHGMSGAQPCFVRTWLPPVEWKILIGTTLILGAFTWIFSRTRVFANMSTLQGFYAARLVRTYLGASNEVRLRSATQIWETTPGDDCASETYWNWPVRHGEPRTAADAARPWERGGPLHIVNVTVNETVDGLSGIQNQDRKGTGLALGPCGLSLGVRHHLVSRTQGDALVFPVEGYRVFAGRDADPEALSVGRWVSISGAAASAAAGMHTTVPIAILSGMFNIRLGYWWESGVAPKASRWLERLLPVQSALFDEMFARTHGTAGRYWNVSDGGHFENMGGYELIRRRLPVIVVIDAEADPDFTFGGLSDLVRKARLDFAAEITFLTAHQLDGVEADGTQTAPPLPGDVRPYFGDLDALRRGRSLAEPLSTVHGVPSTRYTIENDRTRPSRAHAALARVTYLDKNASSPQSSWLVYVKATLTGDEPEDVCHYHRANPDFPHETTFDQFFDEAQWESYRRLGRHIGSRVLTPSLLDHLTKSG